MNEFLANPAVQAGLAPVAVALVFSALLLRTGLMELAIGAGFATVIVLATGFSSEPLTAVCKMLLCGAGTCVLLLLLELSGVAPRVGVVVALAVAAGRAAVWLIRRVLQQQETGLALLAAAGATEATIGTASVNTGDAKRADGGRSRDDHLPTPDFFNRTDFPEMDYKSTKFNFNGKAPQSVDGSLTTVGVAKPGKLTLASFKCAAHPVPRNRCAAPTRRPLSNAPISRSNSAFPVFRTR